MHWYVNYPESELLLQPMYNVDFSYPAHLHSCMEASFCVSGAVEVVVDGCSCLVEEGMGVLIPPNAVHSYHTADRSAYYTILFSRDLLPDFASLFFHKKPERYVFALDGAFTAQIAAFCEAEPSVFAGKSLLYGMADRFLQNNTLLEGDRVDDDLTKGILSYIQDHFHGEITLQDVADHLGYSYFYISKRIRQVCRVPFTTLLSQYRVAEAKRLLASGKCSVSQAALASGFGSIRTFNRIFHALTGLTPSQYLSHPSNHLPNP